MIGKSTEPCIIQELFRKKLAAQVTTVKDIMDNVLWTLVAEARERGGEEVVPPAPAKPYPVSAERDPDENVASEDIMDVRPRASTAA